MSVNHLDVGHCPETAHGAPHLLFKLKLAIFRLHNAEITLSVEALAPHMSWMNMRLDYYRNRLSMLQIHTAPKLSTEIINKKDSVQVRCPKKLSAYCNSTCRKTITKWTPGCVERQSKRSNPRSLQSHCFLPLASRPWQSDGERSTVPDGLMAKNSTTVAFEVFKRKMRMPSSNFACRTAVKLQVWSSELMRFVPIRAWPSMCSPPGSSQLMVFDKRMSCACRSRQQNFNDVFEIWRICMYACLAVCRSVCPSVFNYRSVYVRNYIGTVRQFCWCVGTSAGRQVSK